MRPIKTAGVIKNVCEYRMVKEIESIREILNERFSEEKRNKNDIECLKKENKKLKEDNFDLSRRAQYLECHIDELEAGLKSVKHSLDLTLIDCPGNLYRTRKISGVDRYLIKGQQGTFTESIDEDLDRISSDSTSGVSSNEEKSEGSEIEYRHLNNLHKVTLMINNNVNN